MISKKDIIDAAKSLHKKTQGIPDKKMFHPNREWAVGFLGAVFLLISGVVYAGLQSLSYNRVIETDEIVTLNTIKYNEEDVKEVLEVYEKKQHSLRWLREDLSNVVVKEVDVIVDGQALDIGENEVLVDEAF